MEDATEHGSLAIGELAAQTGIAPGTLRMWEARHGFPRPHRRSSGHRRYPATEVDLVRMVARERDSGVALTTAIDRALAAGELEPTSIFAAVRRHQPEVVPRRIAKPAMVAICHAIEDEYLASGERGLLAGSFQEPRFYRQAATRWRELARPARASLVLADFGATRSPRGRPAEVPVGPHDPLLREWALICDAPRFAACLAGVEVPAEPARDALRRFEVIRSFHPPTVRSAARAAIAITEPRAPRVAAGARDAIAHDPVPVDPAAAIAIAERMVGYLARLA